MTSQGLESVNETEDLAEIAETLVEYGFSVIPCGAPGEVPPRHFIARHNGDIAEATKHWFKSPRVAWKEFQTKPATADQVAAWWRQWPNANPAILTGPGLVVIDADNSDVMDYVENSGKFQRTPFQVTTGRGRHYYYKGNADIIVRNSASDRKLDVRGIGGYVMAPGARHGNGTTYTVAIDPLYDWNDTDDLPPIQAGDLQAIDEHNGRAVERQADGILFNTGDLKGPASGEPVGEGGRNNAAASLAGQFIQGGQSLHETARLVAEWNKSNPAPLSDNELNLAVASVATTHVRNNPGAAIAVHAAQRPEVKVHLWGEFISDPPPQPASFWKGATLFDGGRMLIAGAPKVGKSRLALDLAVGLATGTGCLGKKCHGPLKVVWMQAEIHEGWLAARVGTIAKGLDPDGIKAMGENLGLTGRLDLDITNPIDRLKIQETLELFGLKGGVLILDPAINFSTADENNNVEVKKFLREVDRLGTHLQCAIILIHHMRKGAVGQKSGGDAFDGIRGASAFRGWYDSGIALLSGDGGTVAAYELRNGEAPQAHGIQFNDATGRMEVYAVADAAPESNAQDTLTVNGRIFNAMPFGRANAVDRSGLAKLAGVSFGKVAKNIKDVADFTSVEFGWSRGGSKVYWRKDQ